MTAPPLPQPTTADRRLYAICSGIIFPASTVLDFSHINELILRYMLLFRQLSEMSEQEQYQLWHQHTTAAQERYEAAGKAKPLVSVPVDKVLLTRSLIDDIMNGL